MKIACITITMNDDVRLEQWKTLYNEYKDELAYHIIVDNASRKEYKDKLHHSFPNSIIIERETNGGCTGAYNDGIKYALDKTDCDSIAIICNDTKTFPNYFSEQYKYLFSDDKLGMVSALSLKRDTDVIAEYGHHLSYVMTQKEEYRGEKIDNVPETRYVEMVAGGANLAKRAFYEQCGLQDDKLFMYADELDTAIRAKQNGFKIGVTTKAIRMHYHIAIGDNFDRPYSAYYLMRRNRLYVTRKYFGLFRRLYVFCYIWTHDFLYYVASIIKRDKKKATMNKWRMIGCYYGFRGRMERNKYFNPA